MYRYHKGHLHSLNMLKTDNISEVILQSLAGHTRYSDVRIDDAATSDQGLRVLVLGLPRLSHLTLSNCPLVTDFGVKQLCGVPNLLSLTLLECDGVTDQGLRALAALSSLQNLHLSWGGWLSRDPMPVTDDGLCSLAGGLSQLRSVSVSGCERATDISIRALAGLPHLHYFSIAAIPGVTNEGVKAIAGDRLWVLIVCCSAKNDNDTILRCSEGMYSG